MSSIKRFIKRKLFSWLGKHFNGWTLKKIEKLDLTLLLNLDSYIDYLISVQGYYDEKTLSKIHSLLRKENDENYGEVLFFDIGSNIVLMSLYIGKKIPSVKIYAFEPISQNFYQNHMNQIINNLNYSLYKMLLGSRKEKAVRVYLGKNNSNQDYGKINMGTPSVYLRANNNPEQYEECNMNTFDNFWTDYIKPDLQQKIKKCVIKIDVEGSELDVLSGMENFFSFSESFEVIFIIELLFESMEDKCREIINLMAEKGFDLYDYSDRIIDSSFKLISNNYIFKEKSKDTI